MLLAHLLRRGRAWLYAHPEHVLLPTNLTAYQALVARRARREPVAYLTGSKEFFGLDFSVAPTVLIPRPETEQLVELALEILCATHFCQVPPERGQIPPKRSGGGGKCALPDWSDISDRPGLIVDVGTGSGAIAVSLAVHMPQAHVVAVDNSSAALALAQQNAARHGVARRVHYVQGHLLAPLSKNVRLVVANLPYLSSAELAAAQPEVAGWEPHSALDGGPDGLTLMRDLFAMAADRLRPGSVLLTEIGAGQGAEALALARRHFPHAGAEIVRDHAGRDRILVVR